MRRFNGSIPKRIGVPAGAFIFCLGPVLAHAYDFDALDTHFTVGGYIKLDTLYSRFSDASVSQGLGRDFYLPNQIPIASGAAENGHSYLDFSAKETRLWFGSKTVVDGHKIGTYVEADFISGQINQTINAVSATGGAPGPILTGSGTEISTNAYNPALRRAYITYDNWLAGQDWSTFQNTDVIAEGLDFIGPTEGTVFVRQPQIRYTLGGIQIAAENPQTVAYAPAGGAASKTDDNVLPDVVLRYNLKTDFGSYALAGLARQLKDQATVGGANDTAYGFGASLSGKIPVFGKDDIRFMASGGRGIGRYLALGTVGDAGIEAGQLKPVTEYNAFMAYRHMWTDTLRSNVILSVLKADDLDGQNVGKTATERSQSAALNLLYSPVPRMTFGGEYRYGHRTEEDGLSGSLSRIQASVKYMF